MTPSSTPISKLARVLHWGHNALLHCTQATDDPEYPSITWQRLRGPPDRYDRIVFYKLLGPNGFASQLQRPLIRSSQF